jgi:hypothetical protein
VVYPKSEFMLASRVVDTRHVTVVSDFAFHRWEAVSDQIFKIHHLAKGPPSGPCLASLKPKCVSTRRRNLSFGAAFLCSGIWQSPFQYWQMALQSIIRRTESTKIRTIDLTARKKPNQEEAKSDIDFPRARYALASYKRKLLI